MNQKNAIIVSIFCLLIAGLSVFVIFGNKTSQPQPQPQIKTTCPPRETPACPGTLVYIKDIQGCDIVARCQPNVIPDSDNCAKEGESIPGIATAESRKCCTGLNPIGTHHVNESGACDYAPDATICSNCGNHVCDTAIENICNCPADCQTDTTANCEKQGTLFRGDTNITCCPDLQKNLDLRPYGCDMGTGYNCNEGVYYTCTKCGDGTCENGETAANCNKDCK
jgi:hypothetical protein